MKFIRPTAITDARLTSSTVPETDYAAWNAATAYAVGERVIRTTTHRIYERKVAGTTATAPESDPTNWLDIAPTNRWAMFDEVVGTSTTASDSLTVVLAPGRINSLALLEVDASTVDVSLTLEDQTNLLLYSEDYSNAAWSKTNVTVTTASIAAPVTGQAVNKVEATAAAATLMEQAATVAATSATASCYVQQGSSATAGNHFQVRNQSTATVLLEFTVDYATGAITYITGSTGVSLTKKNGWWHIAATASSGITSGDSVRFAPCFAGETEIAGEYAYLSGCQLVAGLSAGEYATTTGTTSNVATIFRATADLDSGNAVGNWYEYFYEPIYQQTELTITNLVDAALLDLPQISTAKLNVTLTRTGGTVSCGLLAVGVLATVGCTMYGASVGIRDYSRKEADAFGNYTLVQRAYSKTLSGNVVVEAAAVDEVAKNVARHRAINVVWLGDDGIYGALVIYGFISDWSLVIEGPSHSIFRFEIEGMT